MLKKEQKRIQEVKKVYLIKIDSILKGVIIYKEEVAELHRLIEKYPKEIEKYIHIPYA